MRIFLLPVLIRKSEGYREDLTRRKACLTRAEKIVRSLQNRIPMAMEKKLEIRNPPDRLMFAYQINIALVSRAG
jgi:hypothetical protein